jgi:diacylglycerol O-acyltransferase / wax synthase
LEPVSDLDATFLACETPTQHLHVLATMLVRRKGESRRSDYEMFQSCITERFHLIPRLRQKVKRVPFGRPVWVDDPDMHVESHLHHVVLPDNSGIEGLAATAAEIASRPLTRDRPLWEAWFVEGIDKDHTAVIAKIHHGAVDGVAGLFALAAFFDLDSAGGGSSSVADWSPERTGPADIGRAVLDGVVKRPLSLARSAARTSRAGLTLARPRGENAPLPFTGPKMSFNGTLSHRRSVAFASIDLDDVKQVRQEADASVNDVLVALCAGVLRRYALERGENPDRPLVAAIPISERPAGEGDAGNRMSFLFYAVPVHLSDPAERVRFVATSASSAKNLYARSGQGLFESIASLAPLGATGPLLRMVSKARIPSVLPPVVNVLISNIRGPAIPLYVAGAELESIFPMGPLFEGVGLGVTVVSYRDHVDFGFIACPDLVPDVSELATTVTIEMASMLDAHTVHFV